MSESAKKRPRQEDEEEAIKLRFVDRKYLVPLSTLLKMPFFVGFLGKGDCAGTAPLDDGSYYIPEIAGKNFERALVTAGNIKRADPLMYAPPAQAELSAFKAQICQGLVTSFVQRDEDDISWAHSSIGTWMLSIQNTVFKQAGDGMDVSILRGHSSYVLMLSDIIMDEGGASRLSDQVLNGPPFVVSEGRIKLHDEECMYSVWAHISGTDTVVVVRAL